MVAYLLSCRASPETADHIGRTPFHLAVCCDNPATTKLVLEKRPGVIRVTDKNQRGPLFYAVLNAHEHARHEARSSRAKQDPFRVYRGKYSDNPICILQRVNGDAGTLKVMDKAALLL